MNTKDTKEWLKTNEELNVIGNQIMKIKDKSGFKGYACDEPKDLVDKLTPLRRKVKELQNKLLRLSGFSVFD